MRKFVLALLLAAAGVLGGHACAMDGFDLGDMPPLPPPLLDSGAPAASTPLAPPPADSMSPLVQGQATTSAGLTPVAPPPVGGTAAGNDFLAPPPPPPLAPPPIAPPPAAPGAGTSTAAAPAPAAPAMPGSAAPAAPVALNETPQPGRINGGRVNVRAGPNTQYESVAVLTSGVPVTVMARHGDWYKIVFPADQLASIHKSLVTAEITGEIPETGLPGIVNANNAEVHAFYWDKSTVVGMLNQGDPVVIKQERGQWYRIDAPATARAFVSAQYVRLEGDGQVVADAAPAPVNPSVDLTAGTDPGTGRVKLSENDRRVAELKEQYFKRIKDQYEAEIAAEEAAYQAAVEESERQSKQLDLALQDLDSRLAAIDQETNQRMNYVAQAYAPTVLTTVGAAEWAPPDPATGGYTGWVENIGRVGEAPSAHRLTKAGEIRFYLRSNRYNLDEFNNRRVWVNGSVEPASGASAAVLNVEQIRILTELEIAEGMQQGAPYAAAPQQQPYTVYDYAAQQPQVQAQPYYGATGAVQTPMYGEAVAMPMYDSAGNIISPAPGAVLPMDAYAGGAGAQAAQQYTATPTLQPGEIQYDPATGLPMNLSPGAVIDPYAMGTFGSEIPPAQMPSQPAAQPSGMMVSDPSQLPDVVGAGTGVYTGGTTPTFGMDSGLGSGIGEVESDYYEQPVISEIAPE